MKSDSEATDCERRIVYSAGFNVDRRLQNTARIDIEVAELRELQQAGAATVLLSHQGDYAAGSADHLDYVAEYLTTQCGLPCDYFPEFGTADALRRAQSIRHGETVLFGNVRMGEAEQINDKRLAQRLARLGSSAIIGGFCKAHRAHASNVGLCSFTTSSLSESFRAEEALLSRWRYSTRRPKVVILGGSKVEKVEYGLIGMYDEFDEIVLGGTLLERLLAVLAGDVSAGRTSQVVAGSLLKSVARLLERDGGRKIRLPESVLIAPESPSDLRPAQWIKFGPEIPSGWTIVDFELSTESLAAIRYAALDGLVIIAGSPSHSVRGCARAESQLSGVLCYSQDRVLILGGDTATDLGIGGIRSTGGGSALQFLAQGYTTVGKAIEGKRPQSEF